MRPSILSSGVTAGSLLSALAISLSLATGVRAATISSGQAFVTLGPDTAEPTGNVTTATDFTLGGVISNNDNTGIFSGMPSQSFGSIMFNPADAASFSFGNSVFGNFASTSITQSSGGSTSVDFTVMGDWRPGTYCNDPAGCPLTGGPFPASVILGLTQAGGTGAISASMTFSTTTPEIPLPAALPLFATGIGGLGLLGWRRKRRAQAVS